MNGEQYAALEALQAGCGRLAALLSVIARAIGTTQEAEAIEACATLAMHLSFNVDDIDGFIDAQIKHNRPA